VQAADGAAADIRGTCQLLGAHLKRGMADMKGRAPGNTTIKSMHAVQEDGSGWDAQPAVSRGGGGCGAAMRCMAIGLRFPTQGQLPWLLAYAVESSKVTHNNALGWFGGFVAAFFTSLALQGVSPEHWCGRLRETAPALKQHLVSFGRDMQQIKDVDEEVDAWVLYGESMQLPGFEKGREEVEATAAAPAWQRGSEWCDGTAPAAGIRDKHFAKITPCKWPGGTGRGACLIAYDALLAAGACYDRLVNCAMLHGGDNDSTGAIAAAWWGARYGMQGVPSGHVASLEYRARMEAAAEALLALSQAP